MEVTELKKHIKAKEFDKWYIFHGEEHQVMKIFLKQMAKVLGAELSYIDSIYDVVSQAKVKSLIPTKHIYVIMDDKDFLTTEKMWDKFIGLKDDIVVFYYTSSDQRLKFWKKFKDRAIEFKKLDERSLTKYIQKEIPLSENNCHRLIEVCESDYSRILLEIDKIKHWREGYGRDKQQLMPEDNALLRLLNDGTIYQPPKDAIFDFVNAVLERNPTKAFNLLEQSYAVGEANMVLLSVLYTNVRNLLIYQSAKPGDDTGLTGWQKKNIAPFKNNYSNGELVKMMNLIRECEKGIKTGTMPDDISVQYVMVNVM